MTLHLRPITRENWRDIVDLKVRRDQRRMVADNTRSLAQAFSQSECVPRGAYVGDRPVGFVMYCRDPDDGEWWIQRIMIDRRQQGRGHGDALVAAVIREIADAHAPARLFISWMPDNARAEALYLKHGFRRDGRVLYGEVVGRLDL